MPFWFILQYLLCLDVQTLTSKGPINWRRTLAIAAFGFVWAGPSAHYWQAWLQKTFPKKDDKTLIQKVPGFVATSCIALAGTHRWSCMCLWWRL